MRKLPFRALQFSVIAATLVGTAAVAAEDPELLIKQGIELRRAGDNARAQGYFQRAYDLARTPRSAAQLGLVEFALQRWATSESHLAEALAASADEWIRMNEGVLKAALLDVRSQLGALQVVGKPVGASVIIASQARGTLPLATRIFLTPGVVLVRVEATGYIGVERSIRVVAGSEETIEVALLLAPALAPRVLKVDPNPLPVISHPPEDALAGDRPQRSWKRRAAWGSAGISVALVGVGAATALSSDAKYKEFNGRLLTDTNTTECATELPDRGGKECGDILASARRARQWAIAGFVGATVAASVSALLFVVSARESTSRSGQVACGPKLNGDWGASCLLTF